MFEIDRQYELHLTAEPRRLAVVRRIVTAHLRHWRLADLVDPTVLGITELLANVHRHVGPDAACVLRISMADGSLRCEVHDAGRVLPRLLEPEEDEMNGRGLALVAAFSKEWGAQAEETGKVVWFALQAVPALRPALRPALHREPRAPEVPARPQRKAVTRRYREAVGASPTLSRS